VDRDSIDRIRSATFPVGRRGYEKREVDRFLNKLADWLESGGGDQTRAELLKRDLERVGQQTGKILTDAHDTARSILTTHREKLEDVTRRLLEVEVMEGDELRQLLGTVAPPQET
jgi:DivIVA domain-containing protein